MDSLSKVAAFDIDKLLSKTSQISKDGYLQYPAFLVKGMGPGVFGCSSRRYYAATVDRGKFLNFS